MKRKLTMMLLCMMVAVTALAQSAISGTVVSAQDGEPIIGAAVNPSLTLWGNFHKFLVIFSS